MPESGTQNSGACLRCRASLFGCQRASVGREGSRRRRGPARGTGNFGSREQPVARPTIRDRHVCPVLTDVSVGLSVVRAHSSRGPHLRMTYTFCARKRHGWREVNLVTPGRAGRNKSRFSDVAFRIRAQNCSRKMVTCASRQTPSPCPLPLKRARGSNDRLSRPSRKNGQARPVSKEILSHWAKSAHQIWSGNPSPSGPGRPTKHGQGTPLPPGQVGRNGRVRELLSLWERSARKGRVREKQKQQSATMNKGS